MAHISHDGLAVRTIDCLHQAPTVVESGIKWFQHSWHRVGGLAAELRSLSITRLRELAGFRSKRHRETVLLALLVAC